LKNDMNDTIRSYRGLEIYPLIYPHEPRGADGSRHYDSGFDAAVKISRRGADDATTTSRVYRVPGAVPFSGSGEARLASMKYAEELIDGKVAGESIVDL
jgi:hypothetical protein